MSSTAVGTTANGQTVTVVPHRRGWVVHVDGAVYWGLAPRRPFPTRDGAVPLAHTIVPEHRRAA